MSHIAGTTGYGMSSDRHLSPIYTPYIMIVLTFLRFADYGCRRSHTGLDRGGVSRGGGGARCDGAWQRSRHGSASVVSELLEQSKRRDCLTNRLPSQAFKRSIRAAAV